MCQGSGSSGAYRLRPAQAGVEPQDEWEDNALELGPKHLAHVRTQEYANARMYVFRARLHRPAQTHARTKEAQKHMEQHTPEIQPCPAVECGPVAVTVNKCATEGTTIRAARSGRQGNGPC